MKVEMEGMEDLFRVMGNLKKFIQEKEVFEDEIATYIQETANESIRTSKSATTGQAFKPLSPATMKIKNKISDKPFNFPENVVVKVKKGKGINLQVTRLAFPGVHQNGNPSAKLWGKHDVVIPRRPFMPITTTNKLTKAANQQIEKMIANKMKEIGVTE